MKFASSGGSILQVAAALFQCYNYFMTRPSESVSFVTPRSKIAGTVPPALVESLERSKAQVEAGLSVPLEPALDRLRASIARMKANRAEQE